MGLHRVDHYFGYTFIDYDDDEGAEWPPDISHWEKGGKEEKENGQEKKENLKGKMWKIENGMKMEGEKYEEEHRTFFFFACHFLKPLKFVWGLPKWTIFTRKKHISRRQKFRKSDSAPLEKHFSYATALIEHFICEICVSILKITAASGDKLNSQITVNYKLSLLGNNMDSMMKQGIMLEITQDSFSCKKFLVDLTVPNNPSDDDAY